MPHDIKGQGIYAYVTLNAGVEPTEELRKQLVQWVRKEIGPIATPDVIQFAPACPRPAAARSCGVLRARSPENDTGNLRRYRARWRTRSGARFRRDPTGGEACAMSAGQRKPLAFHQPLPQGDLAESLERKNSRHAPATRFLPRACRRLAPPACLSPRGPVPPRRITRITPAWRWTRPPRPGSCGP